MVLILKITFKNPLHFGELEQLKNNDTNYWE